jgi:predicted HTH domain antitoxin
MSDAVGIRWDKDFLEKVDNLSKEEISDRSSIIRKLAYTGYNEIMKKKAFSKYIEGRITLSEAARLSEITLWEMEKYLVEHGYKSEYSVEDLKKELELI